MKKRISNYFDKTFFHFFVLIILGMGIAVLPWVFGPLFFLCFFKPPSWLDPDQDD